MQGMLLTCMCVYGYMCVSAHGVFVCSVKINFLLCKYLIRSMVYLSFTVSYRKNVKYILLIASVHCINYSVIFHSRHNERWGKQAPSRPLPLHRARSQSEPNLLDLMNNSSHIGEEEPELSFLEEHDHNEERGGASGSGDPPIFYASSSHLDQRSNPQLIHPGQRPLLSLPVNKAENIMNYLASLPNVAVEEDQGFSGDNTQCMSESGSGYSSPVSTPTDDEHIHTRYSKLAQDIRRNSKRKSKGEVTVFAATTDTSREVSHEGAAAAATESLPSACPISHIQTAPVPLTSLVHSEVDSEQQDMKEELSSATNTKPDGETEDSENPSDKLHVLAQIPSFHQGFCKPFKSTSVPREVVEHCQAAEGSLGNNQDTEAPCDSESSLLVGVGSSRDSSGTIKDPQIYSVPERVKEIEEMSLQKASFSSLTTAIVTPKTSPIPMETSGSSVPTATKQSSIVSMDPKQTSPLPMETKQPSSPPIESPPPSMESDQSLPNETELSPPFQTETEQPSLIPMETSPTVPTDTLLPPSVPIDSPSVPIDSPSDHMETDESLPSVPKVQPENENSIEELSGDIVADKEEVAQPGVGVSRSSSGHSIASFASGEASDKELEDLTSKDGPATPPTCTRHASLSPSPQFQKHPSYETHVRTVSCSGIASAPESSPPPPPPQAQVRAEEASPHSPDEDNDEKKSLLGPGAVKARVLDIERTQEHTSASDELMSRRLSPPFLPVHLDEDSTRLIMRRHSLNRRPASEIIQERSSCNSTSGAAGLHQRRETTPPALMAAWKPLVDVVPMIPVQDLKKKFEDSDSVSMAGSIGSASGARSFRAENEKTSNLRRSQSLRAVSSPDKLKNWSRRKPKKFGQTSSNSKQAGGRLSSEN